MILSILNIAAPLLLITLGALISEYAGRMALFLDGAINLGAYFCYLFTYLTGNAILGTLFSITITSIMILGLERLASKFNANMFLTGLSINILFSALVTLLSSITFNTRGVLYADYFSFEPAKMRIITSILCYIFSACLIILLKFTTTGLSLRISGTDSKVLASKGLSPSYYKSLAWILTAACGSFAGCTLALRLSSFVPGMAGGRGWTALAAVFLGKKNPFIVAGAVIAFSVAEYLSINIQNIAAFKNIPSSIFIAFPYIFALLLIVIMPQKKENGSR